jgi:translation initiation factor IF-2
MVPTKSNEDEDIKKDAPNQGTISSPPPASPTRSFSPDDPTPVVPRNQGHPQPNRSGGGQAGNQPGNQQRRPDAGRQPGRDAAPNNQQRRPEPGRGPAAGNPGGNPTNNAGGGAPRRPDGTRPDMNRQPGGQGQPRRPDNQQRQGPPNNSMGGSNSGPSSNSRPGAPSSARPGGGGPSGNWQGGNGPNSGPVNNNALNNRPANNGPRPQGNNGPRPPMGGNNGPRPGGNNGPRPAGGGYAGRGGQQNRRPGGHSGKGRGSSPRGAAADAALLAATRPEASAKSNAPTVTEVVIPPAITVRELADKMRKSPIEVIKALMNYGIMVPITQTIDFDTAVVVGEDLGITVKAEALPEPEVVEEAKDAPRTLRQQIMAEEDPNALRERPPVVTVLGHVDHGKTTLLDAIRETRVVEGEAGGITQHIGAYQVERNGRKITFLDTPGHEAFTAMRARGASVTDVAVVVVAADDGVMPQTKEAIAHVRAAQVPIIIALNKIDKANANQDRVKQELADNGVLVEEYGGDVVCVPVSAKMRRGIDDILESILLVYDVEPAKANPKGECVGSVIESRLDKSRGPTATLLVQNGTLHTGDSLVLGETYGKVRAMFDDKGQPINEAPPSTPAVLLGLDEVPIAGDTFKVVQDERTARAIASERQATKRAESNQPAKAMTLETIFAAVEAGQAKDLNLILKADVQGSIEPIVNSLDRLSNDKVRVKILHQGTGNITDSDVMLAVASKAIILGFSVNVDTTAQRQAENEGVDIRGYNIIYNLIEDVEKALKGLLEPVYKEMVTGHAEIRQVFRVTRVGKVAGCYVVDGEIARNSMARVRRAGEVIAEDKITTLKRFTEDVAEVKTGYECGINFGNFNDFETGDIIEAYKKERVS